MLNTAIGLMLFGITEVIYMPKQHFIVGKKYSLSLPKNSDKKTNKLKINIIFEDECID